MNGSKVNLSTHNNPYLLPQLLKFWKEINDESTDGKVDILNQYLWYNDKIKIKQAPIYYQAL